MELDCFIKVIGECPLRAFVQINRDYWLNSYIEDEKEFIIVAQDWANILVNRDSFFQQIAEISIEKFKLSINYYEIDDSEEDFRITDYVD